MKNFIQQDLISRIECAKKLGCSVRTIDNLVIQGELPRVRIGSLVRFEVKAIDRIISEGKEAY